MRIFCRAAASLAVVLLSSGGAFAQQQFNGTWSVEVLTEKGECDKAYRFPVVIEGGRARYGGQEGFNADGSVTANGAVRGSIARGSIRANITGRLSGSTGSGTWTTDGGRGCSGRWVGERRS